MVGLRLTLEEHEELSRLAQAEDRSLSNMSRMLLQRGLASLREEAQQQA